MIWMDGWMGGCVCGWVGGWLGGWMDVRTDRLTYEWMDG